jgi:hypothetical protein
MGKNASAKLKQICNQNFENIKVEIKYCKLRKVVKTYE